MGEKLVMMGKREGPAQDASVAIVAPSPPPFGGMAVQALKLRDKLQADGCNVYFVATNYSFPAYLSFCEKVKGIRTVLRLMFFPVELAVIRRVKVVHLFAASHLYFFLIVVPTILMTKLYNKKLVINYRGGEAEPFFRKWGTIVKPFFMMADSIAVPSAFLKEVFSRCLHLETTILPNLADTDLFRYRERDKLRPILVVSRQLEPLYNHECILRAFKLVRQRYPDAILKIVGEGSESHRLRELALQIGLEGVSFLGALPNERLADEYDGCDIMVNASKADNFPGAILEAFMCGLPVVTTGVGGIPFLVKDEMSGLLVAPDDHEDLANKVINLVNNPRLARTLSVNARKFAEEYSWQNIRERLYSVYGLAREQDRGEC
jgi:glycosyltransferase involved in cell wall biosynthesis